MKARSKELRREWRRWFVRQTFYILSLIMIAWTLLEGWITKASYMIALWAEEKYGSAGFLLFTGMILAWTIIVIIMMIQDLLKRKEK